MKTKSVPVIAAVATAMAIGWSCVPASSQIADEAATEPKNDAPAMAEMIKAPPVRKYSVKQLFIDLRAKWPKNRTINIVWHGHSVPSGYHKTPQVKPFESYPFMVWQGLNERFPTAVVNSITTAIGGENSIAGAARFERDVLPYHPDLLFIDYAINDRSQPLDKVEKAWRFMIESAQAQQVPLILLTPTGTRMDDFKDPANALSIRAELIRKLGREYDVPVADLSRAWQAALDAGTPQESLLAQGLHPNRKGHDIAAAEILRTLDAVSKSVEKNQ